MGKPELISRINFPLLKNKKRMLEVLYQALFTGVETTSE